VDVRVCCAAANVLNKHMKTFFLDAWACIQIVFDAKIEQQQQSQ